MTNDTTSRGDPADCEAASSIRLTLGSEHREASGTFPARRTRAEERER